MFAAQTAAQDTGQIPGGLFGILPGAQGAVEVLGDGMGPGMGVQRQAAVPRLLGGQGQQPPPRRAVQIRQAVGEGLPFQKDTAPPGQWQRLFCHGCFPAQAGSLSAEDGQKPLPLPRPASIGRTVCRGCRGGDARQRVGSQHSARRPAERLFLCQGAVPVLHVPVLRRGRSLGRGCIQAEDLPGVDLRRGLSRLPEDQPNGRNALRVIAPPIGGQGSVPVEVLRHGGQRLGAQQRADQVVHRVVGLGFEPVVQFGGGGAVGAAQFILVGRKKAAALEESAPPPGKKLPGAGHDGIDKKGFQVVGLGGGVPSVAQIGKVAGKAGLVSGH